MARVAPTTHHSHPAGLTTVGTDVGGKRKGFHAVAFTGGAYSGYRTSDDVRDLARWCREEMQAQVVAVDAPCRWSKDGHARPAERQLMQKGIWCFSTPTRQQAVGYRNGYYGWMLQGEAIFRALKDHFPLSRQLPTPGQRCCFETFPHAITWHLRGGNAAASQKRPQRREVLQQAGIDLTALTNIDLIDAALCALTAFHAATGKPCLPFGEPDTGLIIVPGESPMSRRPPC